MWSLLYILKCELMHGLLALVFSLPFAAGYYLISYRMESSFQKEMGISNWRSLGRSSLLLVCFGLGLVSHYLGDFTMWDMGLWRW